MKLKYALAGGLLLAGANAMACYTVYGAGSRILYQGMEAPVDLSLPLHEALAQRYPRGAQMVFDETSVCGTIAGTAAPQPSTAPTASSLRMEGAAARPSAGAPAPLFTDRRTAEYSGLPHTQVAGDIVVVPPSVADRAMRPSVSVIPSTALASAAPSGPAAPNLASAADNGYAPDTSTLGAGPARMPATPYGATLGAGPARAAGTPKRQIVITEMRDGSVTINEY